MSTPSKAFMAAVAYKAESEKENWDKNFLTYRGSRHRLGGKKKNLDKSLTPHQDYSWDASPDRTVFSRISFNTNIPNVSVIEFTAFRFRISETILFKLSSFDVYASHFGLFSC
jgi:hypothetical protein